MQNDTTILSPELFKDYVDAFNATDPEEDIINLIPNRESHQWIADNVPLFECPEKTIEAIYYYRWWSFRKHIKQTPAGLIVTEFISPVKHAGSFNSISCATGLHIAEGRWIRDAKYVDEYTHFWFRFNDGTGAVKPEPSFHKYSGWVTYALLERAWVDGNTALLIDLLDDFVADYRVWETEKLIPDGPFAGLFWQFDVRDGMEESITGSRKHKNARPTISSYMYANALAISEISKLAGRDELVREFSSKAQNLKSLVQSKLWDNHSKFFKAQKDEGALSDAREAIGYVPWCFNLPAKGTEDAWKQLIDEKGFWAPQGFTTAERRHPQFRTHGVGRCEWDGAAWPFATSQTLIALANVLRHYDQSDVTPQHFYDALHTYARIHTKNGQPYIGEYYDEVTGEWLKGDNPRSRFYNHSTFADLIIHGLIGLIPRPDNTVELHPLLPQTQWEWFCLEHVRYHGHDLTIVWDRDGTHYQRGAGLRVWCDGKQIAHSDELAPIQGQLT